MAAVKPRIIGGAVYTGFDFCKKLCGGLNDSKVRNEKAGRYLRSMRLKKSIRFSHRLPHDDPLDLRILQKLLSFELNERPTVEEGLVLTLVEYFKGVAKKETIFEF
ncbi:hypothetical protein Bca52824_037520 [Brassica carinata]|uniref:Protein kinase domain-containing protein n=1 Tax=Brassica carinata TaxID=52824 RepID=A0A8X7UV54_BRACI|nr:hypothetical protein Bca52824_037520 [Brassica carinata]